MWMIQNRTPDFQNDVVHYASQYYDPVKAHEYYEQHKQLKGRVKKNEEGSTDKSSGSSTESSGGYSGAPTANQTQDNSVDLFRDKVEQLRASIREKLSLLDKSLSGKTSEERQKALNDLKRAVQEARANLRQLPEPEGGMPNDSN